MPLVLNAETGVSMVQDNTITSAKIVDGSIVQDDATGFPRMLLSTAKTATGTSVDFTDVPSWSKRITVMFNGVSTNGASQIILQVGGATIETTGYLGSCSLLAAGAATATHSTGFLMVASTYGATFVLNGNVNIISQTDFTINCSGVLGTSDGPRTYTIGGIKTIASALAKIRITTVNGTDTFDAGSINVLYEGY